MAEFTSLATRFWEDPYILSLPPTDKLLYMYLISGPQSEPALGIYELSLQTMAHHTGLTAANMQESFNRFAEAGKIHHVDGWVIIKNHFKHNSVKSERVLMGTHKRLKMVPWHILERLTKPDDTLYIPYLDPQHTLYIGSVDGMDTVGTLPGVPIDPTRTPTLPPPGASTARGGAGRRSAPAGGVGLKPKMSEKEARDRYGLDDEEIAAAKAAGDVE